MSKKSHHLNNTSYYAFLQNAMISKKKGYHFKPISDFLLFVLNDILQNNTEKWVFVSDQPQISSQKNNISHRIQQYLPHYAKIRCAIPKNLVMQHMTCMP